MDTLTSNISEVTLDRGTNGVYLDSLRLHVGSPDGFAENDSRSGHKVPGHFVSPKLSAVKVNIDLQATCTMFQFHKENTIQLRRLEGRDDRLPVFAFELSAELEVLHSDEIESFRDEGQSSRRIREYQELLLCSISENLFQPISK